MEKPITKITCYISNIKEFGVNFLKVSKKCSPRMVTLTDQTWAASLSSLAGLYGSCEQLHDSDDEQLCGAKIFTRLVLIVSALTISTLQWPQAQRRECQRAARLQEPKPEQPVIDSSFFWLVCTFTTRSTTDRSPGHRSDVMVCAESDGSDSRFDLSLMSDQAQNCLTVGLVHTLRHTTHTQNSL